MPPLIAPPEVEDAILRLVLRTYPLDGDLTEAAIRLAIAASWGAAMLSVIAEPAEAIDG